MKESPRSSAQAPGLTPVFAATFLSSLMQPHRPQSGPHDHCGMWVTVAEAPALTGFGTAACRGNAKASRRAVTRQRVSRSDRYDSAHPFRPWSDSMPGPGVLTTLFKSPLIISAPIVVAIMKFSFICVSFQFNVSPIEALRYWHRLSSPKHCGI